MEQKKSVSALPFMVIVGLIIAAIAAKYDNRKVDCIASVMEIQKLEAVQKENLEGKEQTSSNQKGKKKKGNDNGEDLSDNGLPYAIKVNKTQNVVTVYTVGKDGYYSEPVKAMLCSVGKDDNTPEGTFNIGPRYYWLALEGDVYGQYSTVISGDILFHSVPYYTQDKKDLEVEEYNQLGESVSAGCVRLTVADAKWIFEHCAEGTQVNIFQSDYIGPLGKPVVAKIETKKKGKNWDPTDPDINNPYMENTPIIIGANDREIELHSEFSPLSGVSALDDFGNDISERLVVEGAVDTETCGTYEITYGVTDDEGKYGMARANIVVKGESVPTLQANPQVTVIGAGDVENTEELKALLLQNVVAYDGDLHLSNDCISVDISEIEEKGYGDCQVIYQAKDADGNLSETLALNVEVDLEEPKITLKDQAKSGMRLSDIEKEDQLLTLVEATDNSGNVEVTVSEPKKDEENGSYIVEYCAKDAIGNATILRVAFQMSK